MFLHSSTEEDLVQTNRQAHYDTLNKSDRAGVCAVGQNPDYNEFLRWRACEDVEREQSGLVFGTEVAWPPSKHEINRLRGEYNYTKRLSELKLKSRAAVLSCTYGQTLCYECAVKLLLYYHVAEVTG